MCIMLKNKAQASNKNINKSAFINFRMFVHLRVFTKKVEGQVQVKRQIPESDTHEKV